jgi:hypothetical protein
VSNPFDRNKNDNERGNGGPRIVFANLRRASGPILTDAGYQVFSATAFFGWALIVVIFWKFRVEVSLSQELVTSLAAASVELSALSLAVLGILHELNKSDRWFKLGLFLVSILFAGVVCGGFFLALTWQPAFALPQRVTIIFVGVLALVAILQIDWEAAFRLRGAPKVPNRSQSSRLSVAVRRLRLAVPFVPPIFLIWLPGLNRLTAVVVLFAGALIALIVLMAVTTFSLFKRQGQPEPEDQFIATLRARYENEIESLIHFGELKARTTDALRHLQGDKIRATSESGSEESPSMVEMSYLADRLRQMGITEDRQVLQSVVESLVKDGTVCGERYSGPYWIVPDDEVVDASSASLGELAMVISDTASYRHSKSDFTVEGYRLTKFRDWVAFMVKVPTFIAGEYLVPRLLKRLLSEEEFDVIKKKPNLIFVNKRTMMSREEWKHVLAETRAAAIESCERESKRVSFLLGFNSKECIERSTWDHLKERLSHTEDTPDLLRINDSDLMTLASILTGQSSL